MVVALPAREAFARTIAEIRANTNNTRVLDATYQLEQLSAALWPASSDAGCLVDRWRDYGLTALQCRIVDLMHKRLGKTVTTEAFLNSGYFERHEFPSDKIIQVQICLIRKKLKNSLYRIETAVGTGYRMVVTNP